MTIHDILRIPAMFLLAVLATGSAMAPPLCGGSTLERIESAFLAGEIDREQYVMYRLYRVTERDRIPGELLAAPAEERPVRCGTPMVREARLAVPWLSDRNLAAVHELLTPPAPTRLEEYTSENFAVIVGSDGGVSQDTIDFWLATFEHVWDEEVSGFGFDKPPCTDQYYFDVYMGNTGPDVYTIEDDVYGFVDHYDTDCPYMVVHPVFEWADDPEGAAEVTAAHEFLHGIQSGYNWFVGNYWMEASATWAEEAVYPGADDYLQYVNDGAWLDYPELAHEFEDGWHEYGNVVWPLYLDEFVGGFGAVVETWEACRDTDDGLTAYDDALAGYGTSLDAAFQEFAVYLAAGSFADSPLWDGVWMTEHDSYPVNGQPDQYLPESYGSNYVRFLPPGSSDDLEIRFDGEVEHGGQSITWAVSLLTVDQGGSVSWEELAPDPNGIATGAVADFGGDVAVAILVASVLGPSGSAPGEGGVPYTYVADTAPLADDDDDATDADDDDGAGDKEGHGCGCRTAEAKAEPAMAMAVVLGWMISRRRSR